MLQIRLLGQFDIRVDGKRVTISSRAGQSLFAYLVLTAGTLHRREKLAGMFWPDTSEESARKNLRNELWRIRKAISAQQPATINYLLADELTLTFNRDAEYWFDVAQIERPALDLQSLTSNLALYQGELLPGFYDDWIPLERGRVQSTFDSKMEQLLGHLITAEQWTIVQEQAERWLSLGNALEPAYRALLLAYGARGDMAKVSSIYQRCMEELDEQFGMEPSAETRALYDGLLKGTHVSPRTVQSSGTVTFLFTDIEGSTNLLDKLGEQYATALADHHKILRDAIQKWNGREMDTQGDAFFVTFARAMDAAQCVADAQRALASHAWPHDQPLRVRMGLHTGEPLIASTGYVGMDVHRAARIGDAAHGGQVLLSQTTRDLISHDLPKGTTIRDLGEHRLKDLKYPTHIFQLVIEGLPLDFPPLRTKFSGSEAPTPGEPPFKGLQYFDEADSNLFFGRELLTAKLVNRLSNTQFLSVIIGASGSGKSSLVRAGLIPALKKGDPLVDGSKPPEGSADWRIHVITPTVHPLEALAIELTRESESATATAALIDDLMQDPRSLSLFLARQYSQHHTLLVIDQFEELFTLCRDEFEREAFIDNLLTTLNQGEGNITLVLTLRADFYAHLAQYPELRDAVAQQQEYIGPMTMAELRRAIEEPAKQGHWSFEPGLVDLILRDVGDEPGALPLLSHALLETWKRRAGYTLTLKGYADAGGVRGAIAHTAETVYQNLSPDEQVIAQDIFLRLTELGEGTEDTRRRTSFEELMSSAENADERSEVRTVLNLLAEARLITLGENTAEVAHEALIREWPTLREWLNQDREGLRLHRHLTEAAYEWELLGRDSGALYRGAHLVQAREWATLHTRALNAEEKAFLDASNQLEQSEIADREAQQRRELEAAQNLANTERARAEEQAHSAKRLRQRAWYLMGVLTLALIAAVIAGLFANQNGRLANENAAIAIGAQTAESQALQERETAQNNFITSERSRLAALALNTYYGGQSGEITTLLALKSLLNYGYSPEADGVLNQALARGFTRHQVGPINSVYDVFFSPDGKHFLAASHGGWLRIWDVKTGAKVREIFEPDGYFRAALSPDGSQVVTGGDNTNVILWDVATGQQLHKYETDTGGIAAVAFSPDGKYLLTGGLDKVPRLWEVQTGTELRQYEGHSETVFHVAFSPDGQRIATSSADNTTKIWETATGTNLLTLQHNFDVEMSVFSPDGRFILTVDDEKVAHLWDAAHGVELKQFIGHTGYIWCAAFSPDGKMILTGSEDTTARLWDTGLDIGPRLVTGDLPDYIQDFNLSPDGQSLMVGIMSPPALLIDIDSGQERQKFVNKEKLAGDDSILSVDISPDGKWALTGGRDLVARMWDLQTGREVRQFVGHTGWIVDANFSPDGRYIVTSSDWPDLTIRLWEAKTGKEIRRYKRDDDVSWSIVFSPDGKYLAAGGFINTNNVWIWDTATGAQVHKLEGHTGPIYELAFSPDSRTLITAGKDGTPRLWNVATGEEIRRFAGHTDSIFSVSFSHDGDYLATGSYDKTARIWDVTTGQEVRRMVGSLGPINLVRFSNDDHFLYTASYDSTTSFSELREWQVNLEEVIDKACTALARDFTQEEREIYSIPNNGPTCPKP